MNTSLAQLADKVSAQATDLPAMYGAVDFTITPERFAPEAEAEAEIDPQFATRRPELLADDERMALVKAYTMHGDPVADAYAALIPQYGFKRLVAMLEQACDSGVEQVPTAPPELVRFIGEMECLPAWLDPKRIEEGARLERDTFANRAPFALRGGFIGTYMNKYSALPMVLTGALSHKSSGRRMKETAAFFTSMVMPDALDRHGAAFKAAAMVRLMHAMVRFNLMRDKSWDAKVYGIPIPQIDQLPAGLLSAGPLAIEAFRQGRTAFTRRERARVELARYRCFLLGLPEDLLPDTPQDLARILLTRHATLRKGFDDTCVDLVRATMDADLTTDGSLQDRIHQWIERGFAKVCFVPKFLKTSKPAASGIYVSPADYIAAAAAVAMMAMGTMAYAIAERLPIIDHVADRSLVRRLSKQLARYGPRAG